MGLLTPAQWVVDRAWHALRRTSPPPRHASERWYWLPTADLGGIRMTPDDALRLSAVWACVTVISKALASCTWDVFLERENGDREPRRRVTAYQLLNIRPNPECTSFAFKEAMWIQALTWPDFFAEVERDIGGRPVALWPLDPDRCCLEREPDDSLVLVVRNWGRPDTVLPYRDVFHLHGPSLDGVSGMNVVAMAARSLAHAAAAERFGASFYHNGTQLGGLLSTEQKLGATERQEYTDAIRAQHQGSRNAFGLLTMAHGFKYTDFSVDAEKAQFIETRHLLIEEVCRWFGVPPHKVAHLVRSTFSNIEHQSIEFVRDALTPWAERGRQEADWKLLGKWPGIRSRIETEWLAEGDAKSKAEVDSIEVQNGLVSRNEARRRRGRNSLGPEGDKLTVQVNLTTLERIGEEAEADSAANEEEDPFATAARAVFRAAAIKAVRRRLRVAAAAADTGADGTAFRRALQADEHEHARYLGHLVRDAADALRGELDGDGAREVLTRHMRQQLEILAAARDDGLPVAQAVNADAAAAGLAAELVTLIKR